jgi:hypothetical protein
VGLRGGHTLWKVRPFAECLFGAIHTSQSASNISTSDTAFKMTIDGE